MTFLPGYRNVHTQLEGLFKSVTRTPKARETGRAKSFNAGVFNRCDLLFHLILVWL